MSEHQHGSMDIKGHEKTFDGFVKALKWSVILIICFLIFLAVVDG